jgi:hypothetical protein
MAMKPLPTKDELTTLPIPAVGKGVGILKRRIVVKKCSNFVQEIPPFRFFAKFAQARACCCQIGIEIGQ